MIRGCELSVPHSGWLDRSNYGTFEVFARLRGKLAASYSDELENEMNPWRIYETRSCKEHCSLNSSITFKT
jgi:hypothetical protein